MQGLEIALGSAFELETQLIIAGQVQKGDRVLLQQLKFDIGEQQKMLTGFYNILNK